MKKVKSILCLAIIFLSIPIVAQAAYSISYPDNGAIAFEGGQGDTLVSSHIWDHQAWYHRDDLKNYAVVAKVKVGSTVYSSGWKIGEAFKNANRVWYANETAHYEYQRISTKYTDSNWGTSY